MWMDGGSNSFYYQQITLMHLYASWGTENSIVYGQSNHNNTKADKDTEENTEGD